MKRKQTKAGAPLPANYGKATPRQVAEAVLKYRPGQPKKPASGNTRRQP